jgi:hypothetical protein
MLIACVHSICKISLWNINVRGDEEEEENGVVVENGKFILRYIAIKAINVKVDCDFDGESVKWALNVVFVGDVDENKKLIRLVFRYKNFMKKFFNFKIRHLNA